MRPNGVDLFKVAGIQIAIDYSWIVIFLLVSCSLSVGYFPHEYPGYGWGAYLVTADSGRLLVTDDGRVFGLITLSGMTRFIQLKTELEEEEQP